MVFANAVNDATMSMLIKMKVLPEHAGLGKLWSRLPANATMKRLVTEGCLAYCDLTDPNCKARVKDAIPPEVLVDIWVSWRDARRLGDIWLTLGCLVGCISQAAQG